MNPTEGEWSNAALATVELDYAEAIRRFLPAYRSNQGALLPLRHHLQRTFGCVDLSAMATAAVRLLTTARESEPQTRATKFGVDVNGNTEGGVG